MYDRTLRLGKNNFAFLFIKVILKAALKLMAHK